MADRAQPKATKWVWIRAAVQVACSALFVYLALAARFGWPFPLPHPKGVDFRRGSLWPSGSALAKWPPKVGVFRADCAACPEHLVVIEAEISDKSVTTLHIQTQRECHAVATLRRHNHSLVFELRCNGHSSAT